MNEDSMLRSGHYPSSAAKPKPGRRTKKRLILSQTMVVDVDVNKVWPLLYVQFID